MKVKFKVEKNYNGKTYYPNIEYVFDDEAAKDILSKTKYAEVVEEKSPLMTEKSPLASGSEKKATKRSKKVAKNTEISQ